MKSNLRHWLVLTRCSNLPTVWSNVISGWLLGLAAMIATPASASSATLMGPLFLLLTGISLLYVAGMILNDVFDYEWDCVNRPERPLPSGFISHSQAQWVGYSTLFLGSVVSIFSAGKFFNTSLFIVLSILVIFILWYDISHKGNRIAPIIMGVCRALLPVIGFLVATLGSTTKPPVVVYVYPIVLGIYTVALTWVAKYELTPHKNSYWVERLIFLIPLPLIIYESCTYWGLAAVLIFTTWIIFSNYRHPAPSGVSARVADRIAAFSLLDSIVSGTVLLMIAPWCGSCVLGASPEWVKNVAWLAILAPPICFGITLGLRKFIPST